MLDARGDEQVWLRCDAGDPFSGDARGFAGVISLGAPTSVYDGGPAWVEDELRLLRRCVDDGTPVFGICFGAQLLAAALGARVWLGSAPEVGIAPLQLAPAAGNDPVFAGLPETIPMFHWHGDSFDLPEGVVGLASTDAYENQAFPTQTCAEPSDYYRGTFTRGGDSGTHVACTATTGKQLYGRFHSNGFGADGGYFITLSTPTHWTGNLLGGRSRRPRLGRHVRQPRRRRRRGRR